MVSIVNGESGSSVRSKLNTALQQVEQAAALVYSTKADLVASMSNALGEGAIWGAGSLTWQEAAPTAVDYHLITAGGVRLYETGYTFTTAGRFIQAVVRGDVYEATQTVFAGGVRYVFLDDGNTDLTDLPGWALASPVFLSYGTRAELVTAAPSCPDGTVITAGGLSYIRSSGATAISDLADWLPFDIITPQHFGAVGDAATNDWPAFQAAIDYAHSLGGAEVYVPKQSGDYYRTGQALRGRSGVTVRCESATTRIHCTGDVPSVASCDNWPNYGCWILGTHMVQNFVRTTQYDLNSATRGDEIVQTTTTGEAANFAVGDVVFITSTGSYSVGSYSIPTWGQMNVITSVDAGTGQLGLRHPMQEAGAVEITNLDNDGTTWEDADGTDSLEDQFGVRDFKLLGGWWSVAVEDAPFAGGGGMIDCEIAPDRTTARSGVAYGNMIAHTKFSCTLEESHKTGTELAYCSHDNRVEIVSAIQVEQSATYTPANGAVWINESARGNVVKIGTLDCGSFAHLNVVRMNNTNGNVVEIGKVIAPAVTGAVVYFLDAAHTGTRPNTNLNTVRIGSAYMGASANYFIFVGAGQLGANVVDGGFFYGALTGMARALYLNGNTGSGCLVRNVTCEYGSILVGASTDYRVSGFFPDGIALGGDYDIEVMYGRTEIETTASRLLRQARVRRLAHSATNAAPSVTTRTIKAASFAPMDEVEFYLSALIGAALSTDNKTFLITLGGVTVKSYVTTAKPSDVTIRGIVNFATNTAAIVQFSIFEGNVTVATGVTTVTVPSMASNDTDLVLSVTPTNVTDSIAVRSVVVQTRCAAAGE